MKEWFAVIEEQPIPDDEYPRDPQDWKIILELRDDQPRFIHEIIYVTITGHLDDDENVIPTPKDQVEDWIDAMLSGLNRQQKVNKDA
jgi:hypothetical protein